MNLNITGIIASIQPEQRFNGKNGEIVKHVFVVETQDQFARKIAFGVFGDDKWQQMNVQVGDNVQVSFDLSTKEWNGKFYTEAFAWKVVKIGSKVEQSNTQQQAEPQQNTQQSSTNEELPF